MKKIITGLALIALSTPVLADVFTVRCQGPNGTIDSYSAREVQNASTDRDGTIIHLKSGGSIKYSPASQCIVTKN